MRLHRYLLDTNIVSAAVRDPSGVVARKILARGIDTVCTSIVVAAELRFGAVKSNSPRLRQRVEATLTGLAVLPFEAPADRHYADLRWSLEADGQPIGPTDLFIAAHALALDLTLVTGNIGEFSRVPGLRVENWLD